MEDIVLTKDQIKKIIQIYDHFKDIEAFTVTIRGESASVNFEMEELRAKETRFKPVVYKSG
jgi:hypothetical protein